MADGDVLTIVAGHQAFAPGGGGSDVPSPIGAPDGQALLTENEEYVLGTLVKAFYAQDDDPGAVGVGSVWKDTLNLLWWERNDANDGWNATFKPILQDPGSDGASGRLTVTSATGDADASTVVTTGGSGQASGGVAATSDDGSADVSRSATASGDGQATAYTSVTSNGPGKASAAVTVAALGIGNAEALVQVVTAGVGNATAGFQVIQGAVESSLLVQVTGAGLPAIIAVGLPTSDPTLAGALWNDGGTVKVSAG